MRGLWTAALMTLAACTVDLPEGRFKCSASSECPSAWMCLGKPGAKLCYSSMDAFGSGKDDGGASGSDKDGGMKRDAGPTRDGGCAARRDCDASAPIDASDSGGAVEQFNLSVIVTGSGTGTITSDPSGIDCGAECDALFDADSSVSLSATPIGDATFAGWGGECSGTDACVVTVDQARTVTAMFAPGPSTLTVVRSGNGSGTITSKPVGINCGSDCKQIYDGGTEVTLTVVPKTGSIFEGWSGGGCTGTGDCVTTVTEATDVTATFKLSTFKLTVKLVNAGGVKSEPTGIDCGSDCTQVYDYGEKVTLTAYPQSGLWFSEWSGSGCNAPGPCVITIRDATEITATFSPVITWDPNWSVAGTTFSNGNLSIAGNTGTATVNVRTNLGMTSGKSYWEIVATAGSSGSNHGGLGLIESAMPANAGYIGYVPSGLSFGYADTYVYFNWTGVVVPNQYLGVPGVGAGTVYMFALDMDTGTLWAGQNGTWYNSGDPAGNSAPAATGITGTVYPGVTFYVNTINAFTANFGVTSFYYTVPAGFHAGVFAN